MFFFFPITPETNMYVLCMDLCVILLSRIPCSAVVKAWLPLAVFLWMWMLAFFFQPEGTESAETGNKANVSSGQSSSEADSSLKQRLLSCRPRLDDEYRKNLKTAVPVYFPVQLLTFLLPLPLQMPWLCLGSSLILSNDLQNWPQDLKEARENRSQQPQAENVVRETLSSE